MSTSKLVPLCKKALDEKRIRATYTQKVIAASVSSKVFRDQLLLSYAENMHKVGNLMLLYDPNKSKDIYSYWK